MPCSRSLVSYICARPIWPDGGGGLQLVHLLRPRAPSPGASCPRRWRRWTPSPLRAPARASAASCRHQLPMASASRPRPSLVTRLEPTLTTMRRALLQRLSSWLPAPAAGAASKRGSGSSRHARSAAAPRARRSRAPAARSPRASAPRSGTPGPSSLKRLHEVLDALLALFGRHHVELVQHQPARLVVQRLVVLLQLGDDGLAPAPPGRPLSSNGAKSTRCSSRRVRCRWRRNRWPRPAPSAAPSIRPGNVGHHEALLRRRRAPRPGSGAAW